MEETHEYANEQGKQGGKNPRKIPKFSMSCSPLQEFLNTNQITGFLHVTFIRLRFT